MSRREILTNGNAFKRTDGRWGGVVWYLDERGERKRKSFSGTTKSEVNKKMKKYIVEFNEDKNDSVESLKTLKEGLQNWLQVFKFPAVERTTYDRAESIAKNQIYPRLGKKIVGDREPPMTELKASRKIKSILGSARRSSATLPPRISKSCSITG